MKLSFRGVMTDAALLWRTDRQLALPAMGVFMFLPFLGLILLTTQFEIAPGATPEQVREGISAFYAANVPVIVAISVALEFGVLLLLTMFLQRGISVGEAMQASGLRMLPWMLLALANGAVMQLGFALFVLPGLYVFARTWMMGPAYMAEPKQGLLSAIERGFKLSAGTAGWRILLLACGLGSAAFSFVFLVLLVMQAISAAIGGGALVHAVLMLPVAVAGAFAYGFFNLIRVSIYRRLGGSINGM